MPAPLPAALRARILPFAAPFCLVAAGCTIPNFEGPQIQDPPPAFTMKREAVEERPMFPDRAVVFHEAWVEASWGNFSGIYINGHPGVLGSAEVEGARRAAMAAAQGQRVAFGEIESLQVDGRTALGWGETWRLENGGLQYVVFRAAVPYDTITYAIDFLTGEPGLKSRPDSLRTIVASFAVGKTTWNLPLIMVLAGVVALVGNLARSRAKARTERHRHVPLVTIPKKDAKKPGATAEGPAAPVEAPAPNIAPPSSVAGQIAKTLDQKKPPPRV
ncbi:MAG: hypothetical protein Q8N53_09625 [Longimicrobiales bacterium]|nr:hypothetical protein [Longimicrobiales bacterium]